jgi:serine/threonine protein kinase
VKRHVPKEPSTTGRRSKPTERRGERIIAGRYDLLRLIGKGGMAAVYLADDAQTGKQVAVKLLHAHLAADYDVRERFANEVRAARRVDHPNVVRALDDGDHQHRPYLVLELVDGESLGSYLRRAGPAPPGEALTLTRHAARGLAAMHAAGVVHRDVTPGNLLLVQVEGEPYAVKISDLGLATIAGQTDDLDSTLVGTTSYMAPELVVGEEPDHRTDIYALGMVMFLALTGELPFTGRSPAQVYAHQLISPAPPPSWLVDDLESGVDRIVQTALRKDPACRYPTMNAMFKDIERALGLRNGPPKGVAATLPSDRYHPKTEEGRRILEQLLAAQA